MYSSIECVTTSSHTIYFAFSKSSDPTNLTSGWCKYSIDTGSSFFDYDKLGKNDSDWGLGGNDYSTSTGNPTSADLYVIQKPANGTITTCPSLNDTHTSGGALASAFTVMPANQVDDAAPPPSGTASDPLWFIGWNYPGGASANTAAVFKYVRTSAGTPTFTSQGNIAVASYSIPAAVPRPGSTNTLDSSDTRGSG